LFVWAQYIDDMEDQDKDRIEYQSNSKKTSRNYFTLSFQFHFIVDRQRVDGDKIAI